MARLRSTLTARIAQSPIDRPPVQGTAITRSMGMAAPLLLPPIFAIIWILLAA
jgi:hypothetical protein